MQAQAWSLFIDESGNFDDPQQAIVAVGVLAPAPVAAVAQRVRSRLERRIPWIPWPFHASLYNRLTFPAMVAEAWPERPGLPAAAVEAAEFLRHSCQDTLPRIAARLVSHGKFGGQFESSLQLLDQSVKANQQHLLGLSALRNETFVTIREQLKSLGGAAPPGTPPPVLVAAGESETGDAIGTCSVPGGSFDSDRYFGALKCLFCRTCDALQLLAGEHSVDIEICGRGIGPRGRWRELSEIDVAAVAGEAFAGATSVGVGTVRVHKYDENTLAALVLADRAANVTWHKLRGGGPLRLVEPAVRADLLRVRFHERPSHLAATGVAQDWVNHAHHRAPEPPLPLEVPSIVHWAQDQAREWITCLAREARA